MIKGESRKIQKETDLDELTYIISHDLQEPLRMISSYVQLLNKKYSDKLDDNAREYIKFAVDGSNRLKQMMDDLLIYSRIGKPEVKIEPVNPEDILEKVKKLLKSKYTDNKYSINHKFIRDEQIQADRDLLTKLFYNIIDNALKFNNNKTPEIEIIMQDNDSEWILSIKDNGMGIDREYHGKIFGIFQKLHSHNEYPGSGIGLAMCEKIAVKHNGRMWVDSEADKGTTFHVAIHKEINAGK